MDFILLTRIFNLVIERKLDDFRLLGKRVRSSFLRHFSDIADVAFHAPFYIQLVLKMTRSNSRVWLACGV